MRAHQSVNQSATDLVISPTIASVTHEKGFWFAGARCHSFQSFSSKTCFQGFAVLELNTHDARFNTSSKC